MGKRLHRQARSARNPFSLNAKPLIDNLEKRLLFATINVNNYGAIPNDGLNDIPAIQNALNASGPGDTILFPGGVYDFKNFNQSAHNSGNGFVVPGDRKYVGQNGATLRGSDSKGPLLYPSSYNGNNRTNTNNVTISHLTFDGGGIYVDNNNSTFNNNFVIDSNVFNMSMSGENRNGITNNTGWSNTRITNNYFTGYNCSFTIYGYNYNTLTIANNELVNVNAGFHIDAFGNSGNLLVEQNYITGAKGMGMEFQSTASNLVFQDNWYENPNLSTVRSVNNGTMAYSLILDKSQNITIRRNIVIAPQKPDGIGCRVGFEVGGDNTLVEDNYINGINHSLAMNDGVGTASVTVRNNRFMNSSEPPRNSFPSSNPLRTITITNTTATTTLSPTMEDRIANQRKPGIGNKRYGDPLPGGDPPEEAPAQPANLAGQITGAGEVTLTWFDGSDNEDGFEIQLLQEDGVTWQSIYTVGANTTTATVTNILNDAHLRVIAYNTGGNSNPTNSITVIAMPSTPGDVVGTAISSNQINLTWSDTSSNESNFQIQLLAADGSTWLNIGTVAANTTSYTINGVAAGQTYVFRVVAHNPNGYSPESYAAVVRTPLSDVSTGVISTVRRARPVLIYQGSGNTAVSPPTTSA